MGERGRLYCQKHFVIIWYSVLIAFPKKCFCPLHCPVSELSCYFWNFLTVLPELLFFSSDVMGLMHYEHYLLYKLLQACSQKCNDVSRTDRCFLYFFQRDEIEEIKTRIRLLKWTIKAARKEKKVCEYYLEYMTWLQVNQNTCVCFEGWPLILSSYHLFHFV